MKKKKSKKGKKATFDLEAFERELNESKAKDADDDDEDGEDPADKLIEVDEAELGDDPFAHDTDGRTANGNEPWLKSDRDYTYPEVLLSSSCFLI